MVDHRVRFDADVTFANGGALRTREFRLDIPGEEISESELAALLVRRLGLLLVDSVQLSNVTVLREPHKDARAATPARRNGGLVELSHPIREGLSTAPGLPGPVLSDHLSRIESRGRYAPGVEFHIGRISMVTSTGTYVDTPFHRYDTGADLGGVGLERLVNLPGLVIPVPSRVTAIDRSLVAAYHVDGRAVLLHTGWDRHWGTPAYGEGGHPYLTLDAAAHLAQHGAVLVGMDSVNVDDTDDPARPAHSTLLAQGVPIVENLAGLDQLPSEGFRFHAAPPMISGLGTFPVRAYAIVSATA